MDTPAPEEAVTVPRMAAVVAMARQAVEVTGLQVEGEVTAPLPVATGVPCGAAVPHPRRAIKGPKVAPMIEGVHPLAYTALASTAPGVHLLVRRLRLAT